MGFMDKAKKFADQAQAKLDEVQKQFNESQGTGAQQSAGGQVEYDQHGRPIQPTGGPAATPPTTPAAASPGQGDPLAQSAPPAPAEKGPTISEERTPETTEPPHGDPLRTGEDATRHGADAGRGEAPKPPEPPSPGSGLSSGDPLAG